MNAALEFLLSRACDGALAPEHRADAGLSGLSDATIAAARLRSAPLASIPRLLGFDLPGARSAMLIPFRSPRGGFMDYPRVKRFPAAVGRDGHTVKYLSPRGASPRLYFAPMTLAAVCTGDAPLWLVEGEKKCLAVAQVGLPAVGFCGIEGWHVRNSRDLLEDFEAIPLVGRTVELLPDGDVQTNPNVERGVGRLADALRRRGAIPRLVVLPTTLEEAGR
jgi:hypothetical protein